MCVFEPKYEHVLLISKDKMFNHVKVAEECRVSITVKNVDEDCCVIIRGTMNNVWSAIKMIKIIKPCCIEAHYGDVNVAE